MQPRSGRCVFPTCAALTALADLRARAASERAVDARGALALRADPNVSGGWRYARSAARAVASMDALRRGQLQSCSDKLLKARSREGILRYSHG